MSALDAPARRTQKQRREEAEQKLFQALITVIDRDGVSAVTCDSISAEAMCSPSLVIKRLGKRSEMFVKLGEFLQVRSRAVLQKISLAYDSPFERLSAFVDHHFDSLRDEPGYRAFVALMLSNLADEPRLRELLAYARRSIVGWVHDNFQEGVDLGEFHPDLNTEQAATLLGAAFLGAAQSLQLDPSLLSHIEALRQDTHARVPTRLLPPEGQWQNPPI